MNLTLLEGSPVRINFKDLTEGTPSKAFKCNANINEALFSVEDATTVSLTLEACVNDLDEKGEPLGDGDCTWVELALINTTDYSITNTVEDNGAFYLSLGGFARVRVNPTTLTGDPVVTLVKVD